MTDREKRKKLLVAESEVYRQLLKLEIQNLRIYGIKTKRKYASFNPGNPVWAMGLPVLISLFRGKRRSSWKELGALAGLGWQVYQFFTRSDNASRAQPEAATSEAEEYLSKRI